MIEEGLLMSTPPKRNKFEKNSPGKPIPEGFSLKEMHRKNVDPSMQKKFNDFTLRIKMRDPLGEEAPPPFKKKYLGALVRWYLWNRWKRKKK